jgi:hypothetical protein
VSTDAPSGHADRFERAVRIFAAENAADPNRIDDSGTLRPRELVDAERLVVAVNRLDPNASEALRLAAHCQHLRRWEIPRTEYPEGRIGYLEWRKALSRFHAESATKILRDVGYDEATIEEVRAINQKRGIKQSPDVQTMEDALCLVFLEFEADEFVSKHDAESVVDILQKTWRKMSERGHRAALALPMSDGFRTLIERALGKTG